MSNRKLPFARFTQSILKVMSFQILILSYVSVSSTVMSFTLTILYIILRTSVGGSVKTQQLRTWINLFLCLFSACLFVYLDYRAFAMQDNMVYKSVEWANKTEQSKINNKIRRQNIYIQNLLSKINRPTCPTPSPHPHPRSPEKGWPPVCLTVNVYTAHRPELRNTGRRYGSKQTYITEQPALSINAHWK